MLAFLALTGCARLLRLENAVLEEQNARLRTELAACEERGPAADSVREVTPAVIADFLRRAGFPTPEEGPPGVLVVPVEGRNARFKVTFQVFEREKVLFAATSDYLSVEDATSSPGMVLLLTQMAALNYEMLVGKFQLNPRTGAISLSVEMNLDDGLGYHTFESVVTHLVRTADDKHPELSRIARGEGI